MKNKKILFGSLILLSILIILSICIFDINGIFAFVLVLLSFYFMLGSIIKLCKISARFKNSLASFVDLLFWIP